MSGRVKYGRVNPALSEVCTLNRTSIDWLPLRAPPACLWIDGPRFVLRCFQNHIFQLYWSLSRIYGVHLYEEFLSGYRDPKSFRVPEEACERSGRLFLRRNCGKNRNTQ